MPEQAGPVQADPAHPAPGAIASLEHALTEARAQYALLRRTLDEVVAHRDGIGAERA